nr:ATP synthase F0 subunit 6 [Anaticola crassicornis]
MICSLFSSFDPSMSVVGLGSQFKWFYSLFILCFVGWNFFLSNSSMPLFLKKIIIYVIDLMIPIFKSSYKSLLMMVVSLFMIILFLNEIGLVPFFFTPTSHLVFNLSFALPLWMGGVVYMFYKSWATAVAHLVPSGCPLVLIPLLIFIESISLMIRPFSLSIRLMSNIMAGHMILTLIGSSITKCSMIVGLIGVMAQTILVAFEICMVLVQAYVFMNLLMLYWEENN